MILTYRFSHLAIRIFGAMPVVLKNHADFGELIKILGIMKPRMHENK